MDTQTPLLDMREACLPDESQDLRDMLRLDGVPDGLFTLITRTPKTDPWELFRAASALLAEGFERADLAKAAGLNKPALDKIMAMARVIPALANLRAAGGTWLEVAKMSPLAQERLVELAKKGRITSAHCHEATRAQRKAASVTLPAIFGNLPGWEAPKPATVVAPAAVAIPAGNSQATLLAEAAKVLKSTNTPEAVALAGRIEEALR